MKEIGLFSYISSAIPEGYVCSGCGARGCKLWRQYQTFAENIDLLCAPCAGKDQHTDLSSLDVNGKHDVEDGRSDTIGWLVPAVPTEDGETYWGYTSVPESGVLWWRKLPTQSSSDVV
jgi:hypothetical protein